LTNAKAEAVFASIDSEATFKVNPKWANKKNQEIWKHHTYFFSFSIFDFYFKLGMVSPDL